MTSQFDSGSLPYRVVDSRDGRVLCRAVSIGGLYPESEQDWAVREEYREGRWHRIATMRRGPDGKWL